jgi:hypothetical protein
MTLRTGSVHINGRHSGVFKLLQLLRTLLCGHKTVKIKIVQKINIRVIISHNILIRLK